MAVHSLSHAPSFSLSSLSCSIEMSLCLSAVFEWWSEEEPFQPMLMLNSEQDKEARLGLLSSCPLLSIALPFTLSTTGCKDKTKTQNRRKIKLDTFQSTASKLQNTPPCFQNPQIEWRQTDSEPWCSVSIMPTEGSGSKHETQGAYLQIELVYIHLCHLSRYWAIEIWGTSPWVFQSYYITMQRRWMEFILYYIKTLLHHFFHKRNPGYLKLKQVDSKMVYLSPLTSQIFGHFMLCR